MIESKTMPSRICRVTVQLKLDPKATPRKVWGIVTMRPDVAIIQVFDRDGASTDEYILAAPASVLRVQPCVMNLTFAELQVTK